MKLFKKWKNKTKYESYDDYEEGSIGHLIAKGVKDAKTGNYGGLLDDSVDRKDAMKIMTWFNDYVSQGKYYTIRENDAKGREPNFAIVMVNGSGFDFKEFSCKAAPGMPAKMFPQTTCTAKNWKKNTEGQMWFYCPEPNITKLRIDVNDFKYVLDISETDDLIRRSKQLRADAAETLRETGIDIDGDMTLADPPTNYLRICPSCGEPYDGFVCNHCGFVGDEEDYHIEFEDDDDLTFEEVLIAGTFLEDFMKEDDE